MSPIFSVVVPLFNHRRFVAEAIGSVLQQTMQDFELIVVDDGSTDGSVSEVQRFDDVRIRYFHQENCGASAALNRGISLARGRFVAILNSDDVFYEERLERAYDVFEARAEVGAFFSRYDHIDDSSHVVRHADDILAGFQLPTLPLCGSSNVLTECDRWILRLLSGNVFHTTSNLIMRRETFSRVGEFRPWRYVHDYDFFLRLCRDTAIVFDDMTLLKYRFHDHNTLAESAQASVLETAAVLGDFLMDWQPTVDATNPATTIGIFSYFFHHLRTYGADRLLLALVLTDRALNADSRTLCGVGHIGMLAGAAEVKQVIADSLVMDIDRDQLVGNLAWQKNETTRWWQTSQQLKADLLQQKDEITHWRQASEQFEADLRWQKGETTRWWQASEQFEADLCWQKGETTRWWQASEQFKADLLWQKDETARWWREAQASGAALADARRFCGLRGVITSCKSNFLNLLKRFRSNR